MGSRIKYRNGFPTKKQMEQIIDEFFGDRYERPKLGILWGKGDSCFLRWQRTGVNEHIPDFINYLNAYGVYTSRFTPYKSPMVGSLEILKK